MSKPSVAICAHTITVRALKTAMLVGASAAALSLSATGVALAAAPAPATPAVDASKLEDVVVTARRVNENVQATPVSVSAVSTLQIQNLNITRLENVQKLAPNLTVVSNGPSSVAPMLFLRGIGSPSVALYSEPPVALYIDGVYTPRPTSSAFDFPDLKGIEVLRGPQGTLFGRNTTGGAILINTESPRRSFGGSAQTSYGTDNDVNTSVVLHSGIIGPDNLRAKLVLQDHDRDGWVVFPGFDSSQWGGSLHTKSIGLTVAADLTSKLSVEGAASYSSLKSAVGFQTLAANPNAILYFNQSPSLGGNPFLISTKPLDLAYRDPRQLQPDATINTDAERLTFTYDGGEHMQLKSITATSNIEQNLTGQLGGGSVLGRVNVLGVTTIQPTMTHLTPAEPGTQHQASQEFNLTGRAGEFSYVAGLYYFHEKATETVRTIQSNTPSSAAFVATLTDRSVSYAEKTASYAGYGQLSYKPHAFDDKLEISVGLRATKDDKSVISQTFAKSSATGLTTVTGTILSTGLPGASAVVPVGPSKANASWKNTGWSASASYKVAPTVFVFARASSAFRAGGFNAISTNSPSYAPEKAVSYEGGIKSEWFDRHLRLNVVGFHTDYTDLQITQFIGPPVNTTFITNAGQASFDGVEIEGQWLLGNGFSVDANYGYIKPKYQSYLIGASPLPALCTTTPKDPTCFQNVANVARFPFVSKNSVHVGAQYVSSATPYGTFTVRTDYSYKSGFRFGSLDLLSPNNTSVSSGIDRNLSARVILSDIPIGSGRERFKVQVFGDNLTNNRYIVEAVDFSTTMNGIFNRPRNYGIILTAEF